jgi:hypothetical protein
LAICNRGGPDATIRVNHPRVSMRKVYLDLILGGEKTIELRLARAKRRTCRRAPAAGRDCGLWQKYPFSEGNP